MVVKSDDVLLGEKLCEFVTVALSLVVRGKKEIVKGLQNKDIEIWFDLNGRKFNLYGWLRIRNRFDLRVVKVDYDGMDLFEFIKYLRHLVLKYGGLGATQKGVYILEENSFIRYLTGKGCSISDLAEIVGIGESTIKRLRRVRSNSKELYNDVIRGKLRARTAYDLLKGKKESVEVKNENSFLRRLEIDALDEEKLANKSKDELIALFLDLKSLYEELVRKVYEKDQELFAVRGTLELYENIFPSVSDGKLSDDKVGAFNAGLFYRVNELLKWIGSLDNLRYNYMNATQEAKDMYDWVSRELDRVNSEMLRLKEKSLCDVLYKGM